jgi:hypothetical protein
VISFSFSLASTYLVNSIDEREESTYPRRREYLRVPLQRQLLGIQTPCSAIGLVPVMALQTSSLPTVDVLGLVKTWWPRVTQR